MFFFRTQLSKIFYTVTKDGIIQPVDSVERPSLEEFTEAFKTYTSFQGLYTYTDTLPYSFHYAAPLKEVIKLTSQVGVDTRHELNVAWQSYFQG